MPPERRLLTIHCAGPEPIEADARPEIGHDGIVLAFATLSGHLARIAEYHTLLDPAELERAARFRFEPDRERFIIAHGLLRTLLGERLGAHPAELRFGRGPYGKPFLEGSDLRFNLSDTKDALVIAIGSTSEIGVDVETMARNVDHRSVSEHYFTPEEVEVIAGSTDRKRKFLEFWTRKEAVLKASGVGIMEDLRVLQVHAAENRMTIGHEAFVRHAAAQYHLGTWHLGKDHILSVATDTPLPSVRLLMH